MSVLQRALKRTSLRAQPFLPAVGEVNAIDIPVGS